MPSSDDGAYYLGFDLSTQQLKAVVVRSDLTQVHAASVDFDAEYAAKYGLAHGTIANPSEGEIYAPVAMWLDALDLVLDRLRAAGTDFSRIKCLSGAGMQHGTVFWSRDAARCLADLDPRTSLAAQLAPAFSHPHSPNWQDASTQAQCDAFNAALGGGDDGAQALADLTGSQAHHRFSGPQIMRFRERHPARYAATARISLVSSFLASVFLGAVAPIDIADACGMNLWDISRGAWSAPLLALAAGGDAAALEARLGSVPEDGGARLGSVHGYFVARYGFPRDCAVAPSTGDNPSTILALPLRADDAMVSLGTSTTFLMSTPALAPDPAFHFMNHPTTAGLYMFMLCYKNGALARERVRDALNSSTSPSPPQKSWSAFDAAATNTPPLNTPSLATHPATLSLFFPQHEIVPPIPPGEWTYTYAPATSTLAESPRAPDPPSKARLILESQLLSLRLRSAPLVRPQTCPRTGATLPAQPRRVYLVGGGSVNAAIARLAGEVLGGAEGVFRLELGGNACALGAAYKAAWARERRVHGRDGTGERSGEGRAADDVRGGRDTEPFEAFVAARWDEAAFVKRVDEGYRAGVYETYGAALPGFAAMEQRVLARTLAAARGRTKRTDSVSYGTVQPAAGPV